MLQQSNAPTGSVSTDIQTNAESMSLTSATTTASKSRAWLRRWLYRLASLLVMGGTVGAFYLTRETWLPKLDAFVRPNANAEKPKPRPPVVTIVEAESQTVPQYINCLGTVTAFNSVVVKSRVDGELIEVAVQEGEPVTKGDLLARIDPRSYQTIRDQAAGQLERDRAAMELAKLNYERSLKLPPQEVLSQQERDEAKAAFQQAEAAVEVSKGLLANAELQLTYTQITAPITGRIGLRLVDEGNIVKASDTNGLMVITQLNPISVVFPIPQDEILRVRKRLSESNSTEVLAYDRSFKNLLAKGTLTALDNQVDATTGTLRLKATFENANGILFPNQFVNVRLLVQSWENAVVVPTSAIQRGPDFQYVYVVGEESTVDVQKVTIAFSEGGKSVIESGLTAAQKVVTEGTDRLQPKGKVTLPGQASLGGGEKGTGPTKGNEGGQDGNKGSGAINARDKDKPDQPLSEGQKVVPKR